MSSKSTSNLVSGIILIVLIVIFIAIINPLRNDISEIKQGLATIENEINTNQEELDNLNALNKDLPKDSVNRTKLMKVAPEGLSQSDLIKDLNDIAVKNGITLHAINFDKQGENESIKGLNTISISASFSGTYDDLTKFLQGIELSQRIITVKSINLQKEENTDKSPITFTLSLETYY